MTDTLGLETEVVDAAVRDRAVAHLREHRVALPRFSELADPSTIPERVAAVLATVGPDEPHPLNLFRVHWHNDRARTGRALVPRYVRLPRSLTGVDAPILVAQGDRFPMIGAHKVLAAYGCLAPRIVTGQFDPTAHKALWPSTGNYCRGGVAISRIMGCRGVAILPEGMSRERFEWLERWVADPSDIVRTPGTESNVKEIYDECARQRRDPQNVIFNQFCEYGNHLVHVAVTGPALERVFEDARGDSDLRLSAFVSATGSAGTLGAGDYLRERHGSRTVAVEALECPTLLYNGYGEHNIQGIGDKHVPLIHNVMTTDLVVGVSDVATDQLGVLLSTDEGRRYLVDRRGVPADAVAAAAGLGLSGLCNVLAAIKTARFHGLGPDDAVVTVATDGAAMYGSEHDSATRRYYADGFDAVSAGEAYGQHVLGAGVDHVLELGRVERERIFNLGYFTWVEQQGVSLSDFDARRDPRFWQGLRPSVAAWDELVDEFNERTGVLDGL